VRNLFDVQESLETANKLLKELIERNYGDIPETKRLPE
jgi:hypothetical protein